jgi:hypothetical protein
VEVGYGVVAGADGVVDGNFAGGNVRGGGAVYVIAVFAGCGFEEADAGFVEVGELPCGFE